MRKALFSLVFLSLFTPAALEAKNKYKDNRAIPFFRNTNGLPPGLAKRGGNLPPGLEKHIQRTGQLPPGLQKKLTPAPRNLNRRLPGLPEIYRRPILLNRILGR